MEKILVSVAIAVFGYLCVYAIGVVIAAFHLAVDPMYITIIFFVAGYTMGGGFDHKE